MNPVPAQFDAIRSYDDSDLRQVLPLLFDDDSFCQVLQSLFPSVSLAVLKERASQCSTILDVQKSFLYPYIENLLQSASEGAVLDDSAIADKTQAYSFISNHRDIVLDPALLCFLLIRNQFPDTAEIAIGDNLLIFDWIKHIVRLNRAFIVQRGLNLRETLLASQRLSAYMHYVITQKHHSLWIAQREGRAKDSSDRTQDSVLKMIAMGRSDNVIASLREMNIVPLTISYEYDPCDYLKAQEFQQKRDDAAFKKSKADDLQNMHTGIMGRKGHIRFVMAPPVNEWLDTLGDVPRAELFPMLSQHIDKEIHRHYSLFPGNYIAFDQLHSQSRFHDRYSAQETEAFNRYVSGQLEKIELPNPDMPFLRERLLTMYANPVGNWIEANEE